MSVRKRELVVCVRKCAYTLVCVCTLVHVSCKHGVCLCASGNMWFVCVSACARVCAHVGMRCVCVSAHEVLSGLCVRL